MGKLTWEQATSLIGDQHEGRKIIGVTGAVNGSMKQGIYLVLVSPTEKAEYLLVG